MIKTAKKLLDNGLVTISCNSNKIPCIKKWTQIDNNSCIENIKPDRNLGILTGKISNITVIDIDIKDNGKDTWDELINKHGEPITPKVRTGTGGFHYYFKYTDKLKSDSKVVKYNDKLVGIDIKNDGGYVVCPPSINNNGDKYQWINHPKDIDFAEIPKWFFTYLKDKKTKDKTNKVTKHRDIKHESDVEEVECERLHDKLHIEKMLNILSQERVDNYQSWIDVGMCLFNSERKSNEYYCLWKEWSKKSNKYKEGDCQEKWVTFSKQENGLTLGSLHYWARTDNQVQYNKYKKEDCIQKFIGENHDTLSIDEDSIEVNNIISNPVKCMADIGNKYCFVSKHEHDEPNNYIELVKKDGAAYISCKHIECDGKILKDQMIPLDEKTMKIIFDGSKNITIIGQVNNIHNYGNINEEADILICDNYDIFEDKEFNGYVMESLNATPYDIAKVLWYMYKNEYNCTKNKVWYKYENHRWNFNCIDLREIISNELPKTYKTVLKYYKNLLKQLDDELNTKDVSFKIKRITELIKALKKTCNKNNIITEACDIFYANNRDFENKLDQNAYLLGFTNGVYDLKTFTFRDGNINDNITMTTGYSYKDKYTKHKDDLMKFLQEIQPNDIERNYMLTYFSLSLVGINTQEIIGILSGSGRNGKSKIAELLGLTLGDYFETISASMLTKEQPSANAPRPELLLLKNKRLVLASEPESNQKLNAAFIKLLTGNDPVSARNLYDNEVISFIPKFNLSLLCNDIPAFDKNDDAIWDRARCIEFPIKFVSKPTNDTQKQIDYKLKDKLVKWNKDFMLLLIEKYKEFEKNGLQTTENIMKFTMKTKEENDVFKQYLDERTENSDKHIHTSTLYDDFKIWFMTNNPNRKVPSNREFVKEIRKWCNIEKVKINNKTSTGIKNITVVDN